MALSRRTGRSRFTLVLLVLTSITFLTLDFRGSSAVQTARDAAATVFSPLRGAADTVFSPVGDAWNGAWHYDEVNSENEALRARVAELEGQAATNVDAAKQLAELAKLEQLGVVADIPHVTAAVTSGPIANFEHTMEIDKGTGAGIKVGMPVVTGAGLVGRVTQVTSNHAVIKLITDPDSRFGVRLTTLDQIGEGHGTGDGNPLRVDSGIDPKAVVPTGEVVTTSGLQRSIFPAGIPIGTVTKAELSPDQLTTILTIQPLADLSHLSYVRVLLREPPP
jgi:rod shape-determining protein MreC